MQHVCQVKYPISIFLSSSMQEEKFLDQRNAIRILFDRWPLFSLFRIEDWASPENVTERCLDQVKRSDIFLLVLQEERRELVAREFHVASDAKVRIFAYIHTGHKTPELQELIEEVRQVCTYKKFSSTVELVDAIERDLLSNLVDTYKLLYEENKQLKETLQRATTDRSLIEEGLPEESGS